MSSRGMAVVVVLVAGMAFFGLAAAVALVAARNRVSRRAFVQVAVIIGVVESLVLALGAAALNGARGGDPALTTALLWYVGAGWIVVQAVVLGWLVWAWWRARR
jgi:hypothetical protein